MSLRLLKEGTLSQKCSAIITVTSFADEFDVYRAIDAVADTLDCLLYHPQLNELYWRKTIEFGLRPYSRLVAAATNADLGSNIVNRFHLIMRRTLTIADEQIVGFALTAVYQDAPIQSLPLLGEIRMLRNANPEHVQRLGFLFDHCEERLLEVSGGK